MSLTGAYSPTLFNDCLHSQAATATYLIHSLGHAAAYTKVASNFLLQLSLHF